VSNVTSSRECDHSDEMIISVLDYRFRECLTMGEIAKKTGLSRNAISGIIFRHKDSFTGIKPDDNWQSIGDLAAKMIEGYGK